MTRYTLLFQLIVLILLPGWTYLQGAGKQARYAAQLKKDPKLRISKHLVDTEKFFVYGKITGDSGIGEKPMAVVALSDTFQENEIVDINHFSRIDSYYGLNLPVGNYRPLSD